MGIHLNFSDVSSLSNCHVSVHSSKTACETIFVQKSGIQFDLLFLSYAHEIFG